MHELGHDHFGCQHLLLAILRDASSQVTDVLARYGVQLDDVRREVLRIYDGTMVWAAADSDPA